VSNVVSCDHQLTLEFNRRLLAAKADTLPAVKSAATAILNIVTEQTNYVAFCAEWDISAQELDGAIETSPCTAYGAYLIDVGVRGAMYPNSAVRKRETNYMMQETMRRL
jgi:thiaminase